jgi:hypothetical protein
MQVLKMYWCKPAVLTALMAVLFGYPVGAEDAPRREQQLAFQEVNDKFHRDYAQAKAEIRDGLGPIIICNHSEMTLLKGASKYSEAFIGSRYTGLKQISHITLDVFVLLTNHTGEVLPQATIERLRELKSDIKAAENQLPDNQGLPPSDLLRQRQLLDRTAEFLDLVIKDKQVSAVRLRRYVRDCALPDLSNAYEATGAQIEAMDAIVSKWRQEMTPEQWSRLHVIITTGHMPRKELVAFQYFCKLLHQTQEGKQVIVAELLGPADDDQLIDLLVTHILDGKVAVEFFNDPWRMHRDLLSDAAKKYLRKHALQAKREL